MTIYWPYGGEAVNFVEARMAPMWYHRKRIPNGFHEVEICFSEPKRLKKTLEIKESVAWLVKVEGSDKWHEIIHFVADDGIREINDRFRELIGSDELAKFDAWNKADAPAATTFWPLLKAA